jgi:glutathione S-transferase
LWRNERERAQPLPALIDAFDLKIRACLTQLDDEAQDLSQVDFSIGTLTIGCALGYADYRFDALGWRSLAPRLAAWFATLEQRPSFQSTKPVDG